MPKVMFVGAAWIEAHCVIPDQEHRGEPFALGDDQLRFVGNHYTVKDAAMPAGLRVKGRIVKPVDAFVFRRSQLVRAQKWGKSPLVSAFVCLEGVGPAVFAGFAEGGEVYDCRDWGCGCGWVYEYEPGEPMGRPQVSPLIQITATTEDQTDNTYDALRPMIDLGPLSDVITKTGEEFIRLPNGGRIDAVTSKGNSRLGQRVTFVVQDETGLWLESNGGWNLAKKQRQGLAGMGGRAIETTNAWNPADNSVAQQTYESKSRDINKDFEQPPADLDFKKKADRRKIFEFNYRAAPWVSIDAIEGEAAEMLDTAPADAERFFGNRIVSGSGSWMDMPRWEAKTAQVVVKPRTRVCLGFDGSDNNDFTGIRLETLDQHQFTPVYGDRRLPTLWEPSDWGGRIPRAEVNAAVDELATEFEIVRGYCDVHMWESEIDLWASKYGEKVFVGWRTNRVDQMHAALERLRGDVYNSESPFTHDGDVRVSAHIRNAVVRSRKMNPLTKERVYILGKPEEHQKIDYSMSSVLAHEAVMDAIAGGALEQKQNYVYF
ncbi:MULTISPECIES: hypothetical protein [unclassified Microbacterium]|uniref:hypothetical protein n=1 Tax=unclassified Microbacterium TaxID=2609290 RepID=UPI00300FE187